MLEFANKQQLMGYTSKMKHNLEDGEVVFLTKEKKNFIWKDNGWIELKTEGKSNVQMTMYEMNEQLVKQLPPHTKEELLEDMDTINEFFEIDHSDYYMLLCKEQSYFTILRRDGQSGPLGWTVIDLLTEIDHSILSVEILGKAEVEIWTKAKDGVIWCLHLFNYERGIVYFGG